MVSVSVRYVFYQSMDEKFKTWLFARFPAEENPNMEKALFDWPIGLQYDVKAKYRLVFVQQQSESSRADWSRAMVNESIDHGNYVTCHA